MSGHDAIDTPRPAGAGWQPASVRPSTEVLQSLAGRLRQTAAEFEAEATRTRHRAVLATSPVRRRLPRLHPLFWPLLVVASLGLWLQLQR